MAACPEFSGNVQDLATFKRDFEMIVFPNRDLQETAYRLRFAVPTEYQEMFDNLGSGFPEDMMKALVKKFVSSGLVVHDAVSRIEEMENITTDQGFLEFVEELRRIESDLIFLGVLKEITNTFVIRKSVKTIDNVLK